MADLIQCLFDNGLTQKQIERYGLDGIDASQLEGKLTEAKVDIALRKRNARLQETRIAETVSRINRFLAENPTANHRHALNALLSRDRLDRGGTVTVEGIKQGLKGQAFARFAQMSEELRPRRAGTKHNIKLEDDVYRELHGTDTGNPLAKKFAETTAEVFEYFRTRKNRAGAAISKLEKWGMPQRHVPEKLMKHGRDQWKADVIPALDREAMARQFEISVESPELDGRIEALLDYSYDSITTRGAHKVKPPTGLRRGFEEYTPLQAAHRYIHFKDGDSALAYQKKYGDQRVWQSIIEHVEMESGQIAAMETFGPNPRAGFDRLNNWVKQVSPGRVAGVEPEAIYRNLMGFGDSAHSKVAEGLGSLRQYLSSAQLGSATLASIPDAMTVALNAHYNGMSMGRIMSRLKSLGDDELRQLAARTGGHIEYAIDQVAVSGRFEDMTGGSVARRLSDMNYRLSGMTGWTNGWQMAFHLEFTHHLQKALEKSGGDYARLPKKVQRWVDTYGLRDLVGDMANTTPITHDGQRYFNPADMANPDTIARVMGAMDAERNMAIIMPDAANRAAMNRGLAPGTLEGELVRAAGQYKIYPVSLMMNVWGRYLFGSQITTRDRAGYAASMFIGMTMLGAMAVQMKELAKGKDMLDTNNGEFWMQAALQGGAWSLLGDLLLNNETRHGQGWASYLLGPTGGLATDLGGATWDLAMSVFLGRDVDVEEALGKIGERSTYYIPFQSIWYTRMAFHRNVRDFTLEKLDSTYERRQAEKERRQYKRTGQRYYWEYGESLPQRTPEVSTNRQAAPLFD